MTDEFLYIELAEACDGDKSQILAVAEAALTHINAHQEASVIQQLSDKNNSENSQLDALFETVFGGQQ